MRKGKNRNRPQSLRIPKVLKNHEIRADEVRVLDDEDNSLGVMTMKEALELAEQKELDVVEVSSKAKPVIVKIISYDKYRYQFEKKYKQDVRAQKSSASSSKRIQISFRAQEHDLETRAKQGNKFLEDGHQLEIMMTLRGREKGKKDFARERMLEFVKTYILTEHQVIASPRPGGRGMSMLLAPKTK